MISLGPVWCLHFHFEKNPIFKILPRELKCFFHVNWIETEQKKHRKLSLSLLGWVGFGRVITQPEGVLPNPYTELQIDSKSASEESQVCIAISGLYISLSGLSWCYLKVTGPLWKKILIEKNLFYDNILKITILLKKFWFSKYYHRINFFLSTFFSTVVRSPLDNIMKDHSSLCRD